MVTCKLWAQLANQLFMISATVCHALKMNTSFSIPSKTINPRLWPTYLHHLPKAIPGRTTKHYFRQPDHSFTPIPDEDDITLEGYFQSEKYWNSYKKELAEILGFKYQPADYVAVHVRRGDYLQYPDRFPVLPVEYYEKSVQYCESFGHKYFKVYSDDIKWCRSFFLTHAAFSCVQFEFSTGKSAIDDIKDMFNASAFIIANSSFSLFPALLRQDNPIVIAPSEHRWFGPAGQEMNSPDRMPERFIKM